MQHTLAKILGKPSDYRICNNCGCVNWYENETCVNHCVESKLEENDGRVISFVEEEYDFYKEDGYSEVEIDNFTRDV